MGIRFGHISDMHLAGDAASDSLVKLKAAGGDPLGNTELPCRSWPPSSSTCLL